MTNPQVAAAWARGQDGQSSRMRSEGGGLYSYGLQIGEWREGKPVVFNYTALTRHGVPSAGYYSVTTSGHVGLAHHSGAAFVPVQS